MSLSLPQGFDATLRGTRVFYALLLLTNFVNTLVIEVLRRFSIFAFPESSTIADWVIFIAVILSIAETFLFFLFRKLKPYSSRPIGQLRGEPSNFALKQLRARSISRVANAQVPGMIGLVVVFLIGNFVVFYTLVILTLFLYLFAFPRRKEWEEDYAGWLQFFEKYRTQGN